MRVMVLNGLLFFWLFSPESLTLIGNAAGWGALTYAALFLASAFLVVVAAMRSGSRLRSAPVTGFSSLLTWQGFCSVLGLAAIGGTTLFASTGILVSAGFTFNEVFFYRFPNFTFSSLLLLLVVVFQQLPARIADVLQGTLVLVAMFGLGMVSVAGILAHPVVSVDNPAGVGLSASSAVPLLLAFVGFEQSFARREAKVSVTTTLLCCLVPIMLLTIWGIVSARFIAADRLVSSSIPYMIAASGIMGQPGRMIMGVAVISGSCAAVNGLFGLARSHLARITDSETDTFIQRFVPVIVAVGIGAFWFVGLAGSLVLEMFITGALLLWLLYGGIVAVSASESGKKRFRWGDQASRIAGGMLVLSSLVIGTLYGNYKVMGLFQVGLLTGSLLCIMVVWLTHKINASQRRKITNQEMVI